MKAANMCIVILLVKHLAEMTSFTSVYRACKMFHSLGIGLVYRLIEFSITRTWLFSPSRMTVIVFNLNELTQTTSFLHSAVYLLQAMS